MRSGEFAGFRLNDALYDPQGENIGYFDDNMAYALSGECIGETYQDEWIGLRVFIMYPVARSHERYDSLDVETRPDRNGRPIEGWEDPRF
jgi:hypothetical protein